MLLQRGPGEKPERLQTVPTAMQSRYTHFVFNTRGHLKTLTRHFDKLVRNAGVLSQATTLWLRSLSGKVA